MFSELNKNERIRHVLVWFFLALHFTFLTTLTGDITCRVVWVASLLLNFSFAFYVLLFVVWPKIFEQKNWTYILILLLISIFFIFFYWFQVDILIPILGGKLSITGKPFHLMLKRFLINYSYVIFSSLGTYLNRKGIKDVGKTLKKEKEMLERELSFLRNQFHSHFTFNFLNFCYSRIRSISQEAADSIEEFSDLLRYSLKCKMEKLVPLSKEIEYIKGYLSFQKYLNNNAYINFDIKGDVGRLEIMPGVLIVFVENAIRRSILDNVNKPLNILINVSSSEINLRINGQIDWNNQTQQEISIANTERFLNLFYPENYQLEISDMENAFVCDFKLMAIYK